MSEPAPLTVAAMGAMVRAYRKASGLSQKDLAKLGGVSRATLNYLESGREDMEIGASRLFAILAVLGIPLIVRTAVDRTSDDEALESCVRRSVPRRKLSVAVLMEALAAGHVLDGAREPLALFFASASTGDAVLAVRSAAARSGRPAKEIWKNARLLAKALGVDRPEWHRGG